VHGVGFAEGAGVAVGDVVGDKVAVGAGDVVGATAPESSSRIH